jgi:hypothetical protein
VHARFALFEIVLSGALLVRVWWLFKLERWFYYICLLAPLIVLFVLLEVYSYVVWGTFNPAANQINGGSTPFEVAPWSGLIGIFFDQEHGILIAFPAFILFVVGLVLTPKRRLWSYHLLVALLSIPYILVFTSFRHWSGGWCPPARFMLPLLPVYALYLTRALDALPQKLAKIVWLGSLYYGLLYGLISLLPYNHGFSAETGTSETLAFLNLSGLRITDWLPTVYKFERWPVMVAWVLLYAGCTAFFLLSKDSAKGQIEAST